jgi:hypothetical protein
MMRLRWVVLLCAMIVGLARPAVAEEPFGVPLMRPDSLAGWDYGGSTHGWTMAGGKLSGEEGAETLLSGYTFGDFELRLHWTVADGGCLKLLFPEVPRGNGLAIVLCKGEGCGRLTDGGQQGATGILPVQGVGQVANLPGPRQIGNLPHDTGKMPVAPGVHTAAIRRCNGKLSLTVDGRQLYEIELAASRRFGLGLGVTTGKAEVSNLRVQERQGQAIFNGKDLTGWWTPGKLTDWKAENNELVLHPSSGNYLRSEKIYANFTLTCEYRMEAGGNSGIGIRTPRLAWPSADGMELQQLGEPPDAPINKHSTMAIYGNVPPLARTDRYPDWNRVVVKADGWMISAWMNGELVQQCNTFDHPELKHRNLAGWVGFQDHGAHIHFRDIRLLEAPDGPGLDAWRRPKPPRATAVVVDRLMNPERLSAADGVTSGVVVKRIVPPPPPVNKSIAKPQAAKADKSAPKKKAPRPPREDVIAQLTGPGAVVRVALTPSQGKLEFYFDGEDKPRINGKLSDLHHVAPSMGEDSDPTLTCITYKKSLKVVLRGAKQTAVRLDYLTFPANMQLATFVDAESGFPRGWLSAASYRRSQGSWGGHREFEPTPREISEKKTIEPGATVPLVNLPGSGMVEWVKLTADKKLLDDTDLWLRAIVDGEPAISAPARFWFPSLAGQGNADSFVMTDRQGPTVRLAMPYSAGLRIEAINRGAKAIRNVGVTIAYEKATEANREEIAGRMRLRGIYQPPGEGRDLVRLEGCGRWVGWVMEQAGSDAVGIESLVVDGQAVADWAAPDLDLLLGRKGDFHSCLSGRNGNLAWQYLWLAPVEFRKSIVLTSNKEKLGGRLGLFYVEKAK